MDPGPATPSDTLLDAVSASDGEVAVRPADGAEPVAQPAPATARFVQFTIAGTCYAVAQAYVTELRRVPKITIVPQVPVWLRGVTNLRGDVLSVVDLRSYLGLEPTSLHSGRLLIVRLLDEEFSVGLLVDTVDQIVLLEPESVRPPASRLEGALAPFLSGVCVVRDQLVAVLDLGRLLRSPDIRQFEDRKEDASCEAR